MEGSFVMLDTAQKFEAATPRTEVSAMYEVVQYTRLLSSSLCSSHTLTFLDRRMGPFHAASQCTHALPNRSSGSISPELVVPAVSTRQASDKSNVEQSALISFTATNSSPNVRRTERSEFRALASTEGVKPKDDCGV